MLTLSDGYERFNFSFSGFIHNVKRSPLTCKRFETFAVESLLHASLKICYLSFYGWFNYLYVVNTVHTLNNK